MSWRVEQEETGKSAIVFSGMSQGIADGPTEGIAYMRGVEVNAIEGQAYINYAMNLQCPLNVTNAVTSVNTTDETLTYTPGTSALYGTNIIYTGSPVFLTGTSAPGGTSFYKVYYASTFTDTSIQLMTNLADALAGTNPVNLTSSGTSVTINSMAPDFSGFEGKSNLTPGSAYYQNAGSYTYYQVDSIGQLWQYIGAGLDAFSLPVSGWTYLNPLLNGISAADVLNVTRAGDVLTFADGVSNMATGSAFRVVNYGNTPPGGLSINTTYYAIKTGAQTFKVASTLANALAGTNLTLTSAGTGTTYVQPYEGKGIAVLGAYVFIFRNYQIDYYNIATKVFRAGWQTDLTSALIHRALSTTDNAIYFCNNTTIGRILATNNGTFDPATSSTYTYTNNALQLPYFEIAQCLTELGTSLLVGGITTWVYPWDRISNTFSYPILVPESDIRELITTNSTTYIFAGYRGRIYQTNGSNATLFKKVPDSIAGVTNPQFYWKSATWQRNELLFSYEAYYNNGTIIDALTQAAGIWAANFTTGAIRHINVASYGIDTTFTKSFSPSIIPLRETGGDGFSFITSWFTVYSGSNYSGFDGFKVLGNGNAYESYSGLAQIVFDLVPVGLFLTPRTFEQIEIKFAEALVGDSSSTGEGYRIETRNKVGGTWNIELENYCATTDQVISDYTSISQQENMQWLQLRVTLFGVAPGDSNFQTNNCSFVKFVEVRIR